jgi:thiosulfate dehydrogenase (quinone) large subunit
MAETIDIEEPKFAKWLFASTGAAWIWLVVRLYIGYEFLHAGWGKLTGAEGGTWHWAWTFTNASWLRDHGAALNGFVGYVTSPAMVKGPNAANNFGWYQSYLHWVGSNSAFMSYVVTFGEILVGVGLIFGCLTGIAAFFGVMLNVSFGLAGIAGVNPEMVVLGMLLILAWRNAGYIGLDRYVLPALGTPWEKGRVFHHTAAPAPA